MSWIDHLVFWTGGVVTQRLSQLTLDILVSGAVETDPDLRFELETLERQLYRAVIEPEEYCRRAIALTDTSTDPGELVARIRADIALTPGMLPVLDQVSDGYTLLLVADFPRAWLAPALERTGLSERFPDEAILFMAEHGLPGSASVRFDVITASAQFLTSRPMNPDDTLWIDCNSARTSAATRLGINANVFVDAERLRRDLGLWSLLPRTDV